MSFKDQQRRRRDAEKRGRRGTRRASAMMLRQWRQISGLHPVDYAAAFDQPLPDFLLEESE